VGVSIKKTVALVIALALLLHNYCFDCNDAIVVPSAASDEWQSEVHGAIPLVPLVEIGCLDHSSYC
jgi:hypothetical protein